MIVYSLNLFNSVKEDVARPRTIGRGGAFDGRRVTVLNEVLTDVANPNRPPVSVPPLEPASSTTESA